MTNVGLTIAAIAQAAQNKLSFFQALQVSNLVWLANFGCFFALASYSRSRERHRGEEVKEAGIKRPNWTNSAPKYAGMLQMFFSMGLTLYIWASAKTFGNRDDCSPFIKYVIFAADVPALGSGRIAAIVITSVLTAIYLAVSLHELYNHYQSARRARKRTVQERNLSSTSDLEDGHSLSSVDGNANKPGTRSISTAKLKVDPMLVGIMVCQMLVFVYFVTCTELLLHRNPASDSSDEEWSFGQILALIVIVPSLISVIQAFQKYGFGNLHHLKSKQKRHRRRHSF